MKLNSILFFLLMMMKMINIFSPKRWKKFRRRSIACLQVTGIEGFDVLQENSFPSIIFLDINMPMMNGFEFLLLIKETEVLKKNPGGDIKHFEKSSRYETGNRSGRCSVSNEDG